MKTWSLKKEEVNRKWWIVDADGKTLGRMSTEIANVLRGKNKAEFTPHVDGGDFVVVINSEKIKLTGNKWDQKKYYRRSRFFGSLKETKIADLVQTKPEEIIYHSVEGMLPKNKLSRQVIKKLKVYKGAEHPHAAQKPEALSI